MMPFIWLILYGIVVLTTFLISWVNILVNPHDKDVFLIWTIGYLYSETKLNMFGAIVVWLGIFILNPLSWVVFLAIKIVTWIINLITWLFTK